MNEILETGKSARKLGMDVQSFSELMTLPAAMPILCRGMGSLDLLRLTSLGSKEAIKQFQRVGINGEALSKMPLSKPWAI